MQRLMVLASCLGAFAASAAFANTPKFFISHRVHVGTNTVELSVQVSADLLLRMVEVPRAEDEFLLPAEERALRDGMVALIARECPMRLNLVPGTPRLAGFELTTADDIGKPEMKYWPGGRARFDLSYPAPNPAPFDMRWDWKLFPARYARPEEDPRSPPRNLNEVVAEITSLVHPPELHVFSKYNFEFVLQEQDLLPLYANQASFRFSKILLLPLGALLALLWWLRKRSAWMILLVAGLGMLALGLFGYLVFMDRKPLIGLEQNGILRGGGRRAEIADTILNRVYRCFNYEDEEARYDGLSGVVDANLLSTVYWELKQGAAGSRSRVFLVETISAVPVRQGVRPVPWFTSTVTWRAHGFVGHAGHQHKRILESTADLTFHVPSGKLTWSLDKVDVRSQQRILDETQWQANP